MSHLCRLIQRTTPSVFYVSRMSAHNFPPGTPVKVPDTKGGHHIVSGSGQFIATDGPNAPVRTRVGGGSSASMIPGAQTPADRGQSHGSKGGSSKRY